MRRALVLASFLLFCVAADAPAQSEAAIGLGLAISSYDPTPSLGQSATSIGPLIRIKMGTGLGPTIGFDWHTVGVDAMVDGKPVYVGRVRVKPIMAGLAYNWNRRKWWVSASVVGGYAIAGLDVNDQSRPAFRAALGSNVVDFDIVNSFVWRPQLGVWYDAAPRVGLTASIAYIGDWPTLKVTGDNGRGYKTTLESRCSVLTFGLVYGIF